MPIKLRPIEIVISNRRDTSREIDSESPNARHAFWRSLINPPPPEEQPYDAMVRDFEIHSIEGRTLRRFEMAMKQAFIDLWGSPEGKLDQEELASSEPVARSFFNKLKGTKKSVRTLNLEKAAIASRIVVKIDIGYYSSLGLFMFLEPFKEVINLFDGNFDYFKVFLDSYVPLAFAQAIENESFANSMRYDVQIPPDMQNLFEAHPTTRAATGQGSSSQIGKANWAWIISNTSLVVPVLLAALVLYVAFTKLNEWTGGERKALEKVIEFQTQVITEDRERFKLLFDELQRKPEPQAAQQPRQPARRRSKPNRR